LKTLFIALIPAFCLYSRVLPAQAQEEKIQTQMGFEEYDPHSTLVVPEHPLTRARYPFVDVHNHQYRMPTQNLAELVVEMEKLNMAVMVNLSGRGFRRTSTGLFDVEGSDYLKQAVERARSQYPGRFILFTNLSFEGFGTPGWTERAVRELEEDVRNGAAGLKIYKSLGFSVRDADGRLAPIDDPRLDPVWAKCGELGIPVIIHTADPRPFWDPHDRHNERWLELKTRPDRKRSDTDPAPWAELIRQQHNLFRRHPGTTFINAHFGWYPNDLGRLSELMEEFPNTVVEFGAVIAELGRQPRAARDFFIRYQDRILFGKDSWVPEEYGTYFRVLETSDEYFPYHKKYHAFWRMYGMDLPDEVLKKVYYKNALRIIPGIDPALFPAD
jgi:uncharacterized protein